MKLTNVLFRKMTILYFVIMLFLGSAFFVTVNNFGIVKSTIEDNLATNPQIIITTEKKLDKIEGATIVDHVKKLNAGIFYLKTDKTLTGNDCKLNVTFSSKSSVGSSYKPVDTDSFECNVVGFTSGSATEILVSEEKYNSYQANTYSELVTVNKISTYRKLEKKYGAYTLINVPTNVSEYSLHVVTLNSYFYSSVVIGVIIALLIIVIFMNIRGYIKNNTKKTRKKKQEGTTKLIAISTLITTVVPLTISYALVVLYILDVIYSY